MVAGTRASAADTARRAPETGENPPRASSDTNGPTARNGSVAARRAAPCRPPRETATPSRGFSSGLAGSAEQHAGDSRDHKPGRARGRNEPHRGPDGEAEWAQHPGDGDGDGGGQASGGEGFGQAAGAAPGQR